MKKQIWMTLVLACVSVVAVAQSAQTSDKAPAAGQNANPPDTASSQTAGKRMHSTVKMTTDSAGQAAPTAAAPDKGKTTNDDWTNKTAKSTDPKPGKGQTPVATGDVNGDGVTDATAKNSGHATESAQPKDAATGQASGKRQHGTVPPTKDAATKPAQQK